MKFIYMVTLAFITPALSLAQILNVEESRVSGDSVNQFYGSLDFKFSLNNRSATADEKIRYVGMSLESGFGYLSALHNYMLISDLKNNSVTGQPFIRTGYSHLRSNFFRKNTVSYEGFGQIQYDIGRGLNFRWLVGGGVRFRLVDTEDFKLYLGPGVMLEEERWATPGDPDKVVEKTLFKSTNYVSLYYKIASFTVFNLTVYDQIGYDNESEIYRNRVSLDSGIQFIFSKHLRFTIDFVWAYESHPVTPIVNYVYSLENGIAINF